MHVPFGSSKGSKEPDSLLCDDEWVGAEDFLALEGLDQVEMLLERDPDVVRLDARLGAQVLDRDRARVLLEHLQVKFVNLNKSLSVQCLS